MERNDEGLEDDLPVQLADCLVSMSIIGGVKILPCFI